MSESTGSKRQLQPGDIVSLYLHGASIVGRFRVVKPFVYGGITYYDAEKEYSRGWESGHRFDNSKFTWIVLSTKKITDISDWRAWAHNKPGDCVCGIPRERCDYHK